MPHASPARELDRIIDGTQQARVDLRKLIEGIVPDDLGVVTTTVDAATARSEELLAELGDLGRSAFAVAFEIDDLYPQTNGSLEELDLLHDRIVARLESSSVGHSDGALTPVGSDEAARANAAPAKDEAAITAKKTPTGEASGAASNTTRYYGV